MTDSLVAAGSARERLDDTHAETYYLAPFLDSEALRRYLWLCNHWQEIRARGENLPADPHKSQYIRDHFAPRHCGEAVARALRDGKPGLLSYLTGMVEPDHLSALQSMQRLQRRLRSPGYLATFAGRTDGGKTNTALLMAELAMRDDPDLLLGTNMTSLSGHPADRVRTIEDYGTLVDEVRFHDSKPWILVLDEMSSHASGYAGDRHEVEDKLRPFSRSLAKLDVRMVVLGHDGDIHPVIREFATDYILMVRDVAGISPDPEDDIFTAQFFESVDGRQPQGHRFDVFNVPAVSWSYNPDEQCRWDWTDPETGLLEVTP